MLGNLEGLYIRPHVYFWGVCVSMISLLWTSQNSFYNHVFKAYYLCICVRLCGAKYFNILPFPSLHCFPLSIHLSPSLLFYLSLTHSPVSSQFTLHPIPCLFLSLTHSNLLHPGLSMCIAFKTNSPCGYVLYPGLSMWISFKTNSSFGYFHCVFQSGALPSMSAHHPETPQHPTVQRE